MIKSPVVCSEAWFSFCVAVKNAARSRPVGENGSAEASASE